MIFIATVVGTASLATTGWWWLHDPDVPVEPKTHTEVVLASGAPSAASVPESMVVANAEPDPGPERIFGSAAAASVPPVRAMRGDTKRPGTNHSQRLEELQQRIQTALQSGRVDPKQAMAILDELQHVNGSPVLGGVDLSVLRRNLQLSQQMMELANELKPLMAEESKSETNSMLIESKLRQLKELQGQLRMDYMVAPAPAVKGGIRQ